MNNQLFSGELVRLAALDPQNDAEALARWERDSDYMRLLAVEPIYPLGTKKKRTEMEERAAGRGIGFAVRTLTDDKLIGFVSLFALNYASSNCIVGIGMGESEYRGKGYGTDAMRLVVNYAFRELNLHRVGLMVLASNARAIRSYEKVGFRHEGTMRQADHRMGIRADIHFMSILRKEWQG